ncbi:hypothetical protein PtA15_13A290 [Puccinia triticina]|uniref:Kinesin motor domain-containing protein n=1 Tax=Puccinia triticina TaxID=208348 RepID=A0ABY7D4G3_9BASI|nr:uncharacterized protein PtA15_13A290 [Puccinia triticina]WAQ90890.1 hypothetical protein PtA15_13A290 [Puccinia triticina]
MTGHSVSTEASSESSTSSSHHTLHAVKVICRLRPHLPAESTVDKSIIQILNSTQIRITSQSPYLRRSSGQRHDIYAGQVLEMSAGMIRHIPKVLDWMYGIREDTHTLQGSPSDPGIIPQVLRTIFGRVEALRTSAASSSGSF